MYVYICTMRTSCICIYVNVCVCMCTFVCTMHGQCTKHVHVCTRYQACIRTQEQSFFFLQKVHTCADYVFVSFFWYRRPSEDSRSSVACV